MSAAASSREEVLSVISEHLADSLDLPLASIQESSRFREDLEADSLDLVELVVELEDRYGIRIPEEDAAKIKTVGQSVDYVLEHVPVR